MTEDYLPKEYSVGAFGKILKDKLGIETGAVTIIKRKDSWAAVEEKRKNIDQFRTSASKQNFRILKR